MRVDTHSADHERIRVKPVFCRRRPLNMLLNCSSGYGGRGGFQGGMRGPPPMGRGGPSGYGRGGPPPMMRGGECLPLCRPFCPSCLVMWDLR